MQEPMYRVEANYGTSTWRPYGDGKPLEIDVAQKIFEDARKFYARMGFPLSELRIAPVTGPNPPLHSSHQEEEHEADIPFQDSGWSGR